MGIRMPGLASGIDPKLIDQLVEVEKLPLRAAEKRREDVQTEKKEVQELERLLREMDSTLSGLKTRQDFYKLKVESTHPDIIDGVVESFAMLGTYEFEVRGLARSEKELAYGFPDKDETPVGFGYMLIEREDLEEDLEIVVEPYSTLQDVANSINDADAGVRAIIINTKYRPDSYRLLVISEKSGKEAKVYLDEDTTFLEFKEQVTGRNLDLLFEDVPVTDEDNILEDLLDGVVFYAKRSEPGTRVQVSITYDLDATVESIKDFVAKYNGIAQFVNKQFVVNPETKRAGILAADGTVKTVMRGMQQALGQLPSGHTKYSTLAQVGITTNPKTGELQMDESKVRSSLAEDYDAVADLFIRSKKHVGVAERLAVTLRSFRDPGVGVVKSRLRGLDRIIENQDKDIERRERQLESREASIRRRFSVLEGRMADMQAKGNFLAARFGGGQQTSQDQKGG